MNLQPVFIREEIIKTVRTYFYSLHFHEVVTQTFNLGLPLEPNIYAFETTWQTYKGDKTYYLSTSPESGLKKMIGHGIGNCFAMAKCFRNLEDANATHIPEFLMLEWYREHARYDVIMNDAENLVRAMKKSVDTFLNRPVTETVEISGKEISLQNPWPRYSMTYLFTKYAQMDLSKAMDDKVMNKIATEKGYTTKGATWEQLFNQIFLNEIEPHLGISPCFVTDFPARTSPLCAVKKDDPQFVERFEIYLNGIEIGNGNTENTDIDRILAQCKQEQIEREKQKVLCPPVDQDFLHALREMKKDTYAGIGMGIDRLAMLFSGATKIQEVEPLVK